MIKRYAAGDVFHRTAVVLASDYDAIAAENAALRSRLAEVLAWLKDPLLSQWSYMEGADFYEDLADQVAAIEKTLGAADSAPTVDDFGYCKECGHPRFHCSCKADQPPAALTCEHGNMVGGCVACALQP